MAEHLLNFLMCYIFLIIHYNYIRLKFNADPKEKENVRLIQAGPCHSGYRYRLRFVAAPRLKNTKHPEPNGSALLDKSGLLPTVLITVTADVARFVTCVTRLRALQAILGYVSHLVAFVTGRWRATILRIIWGLGARATNMSRLVAVVA